MRGAVSPTNNRAVRHVAQGGKDYLVAPLSLIVPGVLSGSKGPLLYTPEEIAKNHRGWDGMPLLINHPHDELTNLPLSAQDPERGPEIISKQGVGFNRNTSYKGKLRSEGWFDIEKLARVHPETLNRLRRGEPISLSTGLFTDNEEKSGNYHGRQYTHIARNFRPDHIAILTAGFEGACSLNDGCGVLVNREGDLLLRKLQLLARSA
jgi:hypothetical protein